MGLYSDIYTIDIASNEVVLRATIPFEQDYPIGIYNSHSNSILFSGVSDRNHGNQLFVKDVKSGSVNQLTDDFTYISGLNIIDYAQVLVSGVKEGAEDIAVQLYLYNLESHITSKITTDDDFDVRNTYIDYENKRIIISGRSMKKLRENLDSQIYGNEYIPPDTYFFEIKGNTIKELAVITESEVISFFLLNNEINYITDDNEKECICIGSNNSCESDYNYYLFPHYDKKTDSVICVNGKKILLFNQKRGESTVLFESPYTYSQINNMMYVENSDN